MATLILINYIRCVTIIKLAPLNPLLINPRQHHIGRDWIRKREIIDPIQCTCLVPVGRQMASLIIIIKILDHIRNWLTLKWVSITKNHGKHSTVHMYVSQDRHCTAQQYCTFAPQTTKCRQRLFKCDSANAYQLLAIHDQRGSCCTGQ